MKKTLTIIATLLLAHLTFAAEKNLIEHLDTAPTIEDLNQTYPVYTWNESFDTTDGPLAVSFMTIDLKNDTYETFTMVSDDPDGEGPAEAILTTPDNIMKANNAFAGINANAFARASNADDEKGWHIGLFVDIQGLAISDGEVRSNINTFNQSNTPKVASKYAFWLDNNNTPFIGQPEENNNISQAVGDWFSPLLIDGKIIPKADTVRHPRTAVGVDKDKRFLTFAVVDGRRKGHSIGIALYDLAKLLESKGCFNAINMDGGGSSIMMYKEGEQLKTANKPSDNTHRAIPVMLGVREIKENATAHSAENR